MSQGGIRSSNTGENKTAAGVLFSALLLINLDTNIWTFRERARALADPLSWEEAAASLLLKILSYYYVLGLYDDTDDKREATLSELLVPVFYWVQIYCDEIHFCLNIVFFFIAGKVGLGTCHLHSWVSTSTDGTWRTLWCTCFHWPW